MKYYIIAGEASGDLHGSGLVRELKKLDHKADFRGFGGDLMKNEGVNILHHVREMNFMGFWEVAINMKTVLGLINECKRDIAAWTPDALILIDYPGFNLRMAEFASGLNIPVFYYISPQLWAWKRNRIKKIKRFVDKLFVILPFEKDFYESQGYSVDFVGHPLLDALENDVMLSRTQFIADQGLSFEKPLIALLPGSRQQEVRRILPVMVEVASNFGTSHQFVVAGAGSVAPKEYQRIIGDAGIPVLYGGTYALLHHSYAALVTSGTATLETALFDVPQVVCYRAGKISFQIARKLVHLNYISLVNLIMEKEVVKELIQSDMNVHSVTDHLKSILFDATKREQILSDYVELKRKLGGSGASAKTAGLILKHLS